MKRSLVVAIALALAACGKQVNPEYCQHHPEDTSFCGGDARNVDAGKTDAPPPPPPGYYDVGGTITGLAGTGGVLRNNDGMANMDELPMNGPSFVFAKLLMQGQTYAVTVYQQPIGQTCTVTGGSGTIGTTNVRSVAVSCVQGPDPGVTCGSTVCDINSGTPACCYGQNTCGTTASCGGNAMTCDDLADCAGSPGTVCCGYLNPGGNPKNAQCDTLTTCMAAAHGHEVLCNPANGDADCPTPLMCKPAAKFSGYSSCQ